MTASPILPNGMSLLQQNTKFEELCRLCGSKTDTLAVHIFNNEGTFNELGKKIYNCLQLQIHQQDELPKHLCGHCLVKLEMFWDFKDRSFRTEQLLIELYKQLKENGENQQCVVSVDANGMLVQVTGHHILTDDLPSDIDISQLGQRSNCNTSDYSIILHHHELDTSHMDNLDLSNHSLRECNNSTHEHLHENEQDLIMLPSSDSNEKFSEDNLSLMQQHLLNDAQLKVHQQLQVSLTNSNSLFATSLKHDILSDSEPNYSTGRQQQSHQLVTENYSNGKNSLSINSHINDNSLGVQVDPSFDRIMSYSSDSQMDQITQQEMDNNLICKAKYLFNEDLLQDKEDLINVSPVYESQMMMTNDSQRHYFKNEDNKEFSYKNITVDEKNNFKHKLLNCKDEISSDSIESFRNEDSNSWSNISSSSDVKNDLSNESIAIIQSEKMSQLTVGGEDENCQSKSMMKIGSKVCTVCGKSYKSNYKLAEHMTKHTGERPYKCGSCDKAFRSKIGLAQHEAKHTGKYELSCPTCGKGFQCKSYLMVHQRVHSDVKPYPCTTCGINFKTKQSLLDHTNRHLGVKPFSCSICNRGFITKSLCIAHEKTHSGVDNRKYTCKICQKKFVSKSYLQTHSRIHTGEKPFICEVCGKGFLTYVDLKIHLTMHTGEKSYVCEMCGKAFARRDALKCHRRMHTGERPYRCDVCGRTFTQFTPMANHKKHHTGDKPFSCETCGKTFVSKSAMMSHQKKHVKGENDHNKRKNENEPKKVIKNDFKISDHSFKAEYENS